MKELTSTFQGCHKTFLMKIRVGPRLLKASSILLETYKRYTLNSRESIDLTKLDNFFLVSLNNNYFLSKPSLNKYKHCKC